MHNLFVMSSQKKDILWFSVDFTQENPIVAPKLTLILPKDVVACELRYEPEGQIVAIGSRSGALVIYDVSDESTPAHAKVICRKLHGGDPLGSLKMERKGHNSWTIFTSGRDGMYGTNILQKNVDVLEPQRHLEFVEVGWRLFQAGKKRISRGSIEIIYKIQNTTLLVGFFDKFLFIYNETLKFEVCSISCGGNYRAWDFWTLNESMDQFVCCFILDGKPFIVSQKDSCRTMSRPILKEPFSSQETRAAHWIDHPLLNDGQKIIATGGEDELLSFHLYQNESLQLIESYKVYDVLLIHYLFMNQEVTTFF
jgi:hypothetical protein